MKQTFHLKSAPDAAETIVKGDFSDKNSTGAFAGRIIGGLNPLGDMRDIAANGKDVAENKPGSYVGLGGAILGTVIPVAGDAGKAAIRANKEAITEGIEAALKNADEVVEATQKQRSKRRTMRQHKRQKQLLNERSHRLRPTRRDNRAVLLNKCQLKATLLTRER